MASETKNVVVGITGGIAAYKSAFLVRELIKAGMDVRVVMTANSREFITPLTFQTLTSRQVVTDTFQETEGQVMHIWLAEWADMVIIAPATANIVGKLAHGIADDFLTTFMLANRAPVIICPAMNSFMYQHPAVQENLQKLMGLGYHVVSPGEGALACGMEGTGRLAEVEEIMDQALNLLTPKDLSGVRFLITAGRTEEYMDPVRCLTNRSSGKMGFALALAAFRRGGKVVLVSGPSELPDPRGVEVVRVSSALQMRDAVRNHFEDSDVVIKAAAVSDFRPAGGIQAGKIKKEQAETHMSLERNPDILEELGRSKGKRCLVGFAAETDDLLANARLKIKKKNLDFIVANDVSRLDAGFQSETNQVKILDRQGMAEDVPMAPKLEVAHSILDRIRHWIQENVQS